MIPLYDVADIMNTNLLPYNKPREKNMTDQSLNTGLDLEEQDKPASNVDIPQNPDIVDQINSQEEVINTTPEEKSVEELREDLEGAYESLDNLMDIRARLKTHRCVNQDLALEALEVAPHIKLPHPKSYTETLSLVNYQESLEAVESVINSALSVVKEKSVDLDKQILITVPAESVSSPLDEFENTVNQFIQVNGLNELTEVVPNAETKAKLHQVLIQAPAVAKLIGSPESIGGVFSSLLCLVDEIERFSMQRFRALTNINTAISNGSVDEGISLAADFNRALDEFMSLLESRSLYAEVKCSEDSEFLINQIASFYLNLRSCSSQNYRSALRTECLIKMHEAIKSARGSVVRTDLELNVPDSLSVDQKTVLVGTISGVVEAKKLSLCYLDDAAQFITSIEQVLNIWSMSLKNTAAQVQTD